jgi:lipopolysaccharide transport system permease protein
MKPTYEIVIEPGRGMRHYWRDLWSYRELFYFLAWRDILVRYKQTAIGVAWSVLRPFLTMVVFTIVFGHIAGLPSSGAPYPILVFTALLPWQFFSNALTETSNSLVANSNMLTKIYFPRLIVPTSALMVNIVDFLISIVILACIMLWYHFVPTVHILAIIPFFLLALVVTLGAGLWFSALTVKYRDFRYIIPFVVQFGLFISPVGFSSDVVSDKWRLLYSLNPMVGIIDGFRWSVLGKAIYLPSLEISLITSLLVFASGLWYFRRTEKTFADVI